ncbi:MAG: hypothetical protein ACRD6Q_06450 [Nitrososphaeraceae archaeon]
MNISFDFILSITIDELVGDTRRYIEIAINPTEALLTNGAVTIHTEGTIDTVCKECASRR